MHPIEFLGRHGQGSGVAQTGLSLLRVDRGDELKGLGPLRRPQGQGVWHVCPVVVDRSPPAGVCLGLYDWSILVSIINGIWVMTFCVCYLNAWLRKNYDTKW